METIGEIVKALHGTPFLEVVGAGTVVVALRLWWCAKNHQWKLHITNSEDRFTVGLDIPKQSHEDIKVNSNPSRNIEKKEGPKPLPAPKKNRASK